MHCVTLSGTLYDILHCLGLYRNVYMYMLSIYDIMSVEREEANTEEERIKRGIKEGRGKGREGRWRECDIGEWLDQITICMSS